MCEGEIAAPLSVRLPAHGPVIAMLLLRLLFLAFMLAATVDAQLLSLLTNLEGAATCACQVMMTRAKLEACLAVAATTTIELTARREASTMQRTSIGGRRER